MEPGRDRAERSDHEGAQARYEEALPLYERIREPYSIGMAQRRLARLARSEDERRDRVDAARVAWSSIDRPDLVAELKRESGT
jgi:hypothetical protein